MKDRKKRRAALLALCILTALFIWSNSMQSRDESQARSGTTLELIAELAAKVGITIDTTDDHWLRKLAHFGEFGLLGTELSLLMIASGAFGGQGIINCLFAGLLTAVTDETIQIFSNRGPQVQDVLIDFSGVIAAVAAVSAVYLAARRKRRRREPE